MNNKQILIIIPARGGSKGIPRKNARLMNGHPLITYAINNAKKCIYNKDIVVTTDDPEIISIAKEQDINIIERSKELSDDTVTLDPVVYDAVLKMENKYNKKYDTILTLQPTSPLLSYDTLNKALDFYNTNELDTCISVINNPHLSWKLDYSNDEEGKPKKNYTERKNRQELPSNFIETGAFLISNRNMISKKSRINGKVSIFEVPLYESIDIDTDIDWITCENILNRKKIFLRADGHQKLGMGHIYHCMTLAYNLTGHSVTIYTNKKFAEGIEKLKQSNLSYKIIEDENDFLNEIELNKPDVVVIDCLDTQKKYIKDIKKIVNKVITIEDLGEGANEADIVINPLYSNHVNITNKNHYFGEKYVTLRDEFLRSSSITPKKNVENILVLFGGTDPSNLTKKICEVSEVLKNKYHNIKFTIVIGIGYSNLSEIKKYESENVKIVKNISNISEYMKKSDLAITSQGRTVYELATIGIPSVVLSQNSREQLHSFAQMNNGFLNLGLGSEISNETIISTISWLIENYQIRLEMHKLMTSHDLRSGVKRVINLITKENVYVK